MESPHLLVVKSKEHVYESNRAESVVGGDLVEYLLYLF